MKVRSADCLSIYFQRAYLNIDSFSMENKSDKDEKPRETVTFVLKTERFEVDKQKLINKSQYFAALLSANYKECRQTEHIINYDISRISWQAFIDWIHNDTLDTSTTSYDFEEFHDKVLILLELSFLFVADNLIEFVTDRLERHYMFPKYALNIWLLTQELNINTLRDLSLAVCLDAFSELPPSSIYELSKENFLKLIGNINIRSMKSYLLDITQEWMNRHDDFTISLDIIKNKESKILYSIISCEHSIISYDINSERFINCWDGNNFFELTSFNLPKDIISNSTGTNRLLGMQITGRGYDLYLCGGEFESGKFNKNVWRYSLVSKRWYLQTVMPVERSHMITVLLKNKLLLVGGKGREGAVTRSVDIYDIYTGMWTSGARTPCEFTNSTYDLKHNIFDGILIIYRYRISYIYYSDKDVWLWNELPLMLYPFETLPLHKLMLESVPCYIEWATPYRMDLRILTDTCNIKDCANIISSCIDYKITSPTCSDTYLVCKLGHVSSRTILLLLDTDNRSSINTLHMHSISIEIENKCRFLHDGHLLRRFIHLNHPALLHTTNLDCI